MHPTTGKPSLPFLQPACSFAPRRARLPGRAALLSLALVGIGSVASAQPAETPSARTQPDVDTPAAGDEATSNEGPAQPAAPEAGPAPEPAQAVEEATSNEGPAQPAAPEAGPAPEPVQAVEGDSSLSAAPEAGPAPEPVQAAEGDSSLPAWERVAGVLKRGLRVDMTPTGSSYFKFGYTTQLWGRVAKTNPGTVDSGSGEPLDYYSDWALRRLRLMASANIEDRIYFFSQVGMTSFDRQGSNRSPIYVHDFQGQVRYAGEHYIGGGIHFWQGLSRLRAVGHSDYLILDNPGFTFPNVFVDDFVVRQLGPFVRGMQGRFGYSLSLNSSASPLDSTKLASDADIEATAQDQKAVLRRHRDFNVRGYLYWSFLEKEQPSSSGRFVMTHHGKAGPILNLGSGFQVQPSGVGWWDADAGEVQTGTSLAWAADLFVELPLADSSVFTGYAAYHYYDFGPNYLRVTAPMNQFASASPTEPTLLPGAGIAEYSFGTGHVVHGELGYILPRTWIPSTTQLQPFVAFSVKSLEALDEPSFQYRAGLNWLIVGHNLKLTAQYASRPLYDPDTLRVAANPGLFVLQAQLRL